MGVNALTARNVDKDISKKILLANTTDKRIDARAMERAKSVSSDPIYHSDASHASSMVFNPDIRYRYMYAYSPLTAINYRNDLLIFSENNEVRKAVNIMANEIAIMDTDQHKYPVSPRLKDSFIPQDKKKTALAIQEYLDQVFFPKLYQYLLFNDEGLLDKLKEYIITGKVAWEILYDNLKNPKDIIGMMPIDPSTLQKIKDGDYVFYVMKAMSDGGRERVLHENQVVLIEFNKYDFGYVSYVDRLRMSFNIMKSMMTSKALWFAAKSQVRMHIKLGLGDIGRYEAIQKLTESKSQFANQFSMHTDGQVLFNNKPNNSGYREFFTGETQNSGHPEIEEVNSTGPDLTETDSLTYWEKLYWKDTEIPYDRIDPNSSDNWGFNDVSSLRKIEVNFSKIVNTYRKAFALVFIKPIRIQLTLKEVEIGCDLSLLDAIKMDWVAYNQYERLAEIEVLSKKVELATNIVAFGEQEDAEGKMRKTIPVRWAAKNIIDFNKEQLDSMEDDRLEEEVILGFKSKEGEPVQGTPGNEEPVEEDEDVNGSPGQWDDSEGQDEENNQTSNARSNISHDDGNF
jgi:hypothetical protein